MPTIRSVSYRTKKSNAFPYSRANSADPTNPTTSTRRSPNSHFERKPWGRWSPPAPRPAEPVRRTRLLLPLRLPLTALGLVAYHRFPSRWIRTTWKTSCPRQVTFPSWSRRPRTDGDKIGARISSRPVKYVENAPPTARQFSTLSSPSPGVTHHAAASSQLPRSERSDGCRIRESGGRRVPSDAQPNGTEGVRVGPRSRWGMSLRWAGPDWGDAQRRRYRNRPRESTENPWDPWHRGHGPIP